LFLPGQSESIRLEPISQGLFLVQRIRDEAHRFGVTYHRKLRGKSAIRSSLDGVEGIGPKRRQALLKKFGSIEAIRQATVEELAAVPGMNRRVAGDLKEQL
jgi:excinuclease ABC subunit C